MSGIRITPKTGDVREFLGKYATSVSKETIEPLDWSAIPVDRLPICLIESDQKQTAWILYNNEEFRKYKQQKVPTALYQYFFINIEKLWNHSNLKDFVGLIEPDRVHSGKIEGLNKSALMKDIAHHIYRDRSEESLAEQYKIPIKMVKQLVVKLKKLGVRIPTKTKARFDVKSFVRDLQKESPDLVDPKMMPQAIRNGKNGIGKKRDRPRATSV